MSSGDIIGELERNRKLARQILARPVRLNSWRSEPNEETASSVYVDVVYSTVAVDEPSLSVDFEISFKRSETRVYLKRGASAKIDPNSVARTEETTGKRTTEYERGAAGNAAVGVNLTNPALRLSASAEAKGKQSFSKDENVGNIRVQHMPLDGIDGYGWIAEPEIGFVLRGSPWQASEPRLRVYDPGRNNNATLDDPVVEILNTALDIDIDCIEWRDRSRKSFAGLFALKKIAIKQAIVRGLVEAANSKRDAEGRVAGRVKQQMAKEA